jgi:hypothetical protein
MSILRALVGRNAAAVEAAFCRAGAGPAVDVIGGIGACRLQCSQRQKDSDGRQAGRPRRCTQMEIGR